MAGDRVPASNLGGIYARHGGFEMGLFGTRQTCLELL